MPLLFAGIFMSASVRTNSPIEGSSINPLTDLVLCTPITLSFKMKTLEFPTIFDILTSYHLQDYKIINVVFTYIIVALPYKAYPAATMLRPFCRAILFKSVIPSGFLKIPKIDPMETKQSMLLEPSNGSNVTMY